MAKEKPSDKKLVEEITPMSADFAQWYTDVVKKSRSYRLYKCARMYDIPPLRLCDMGKIYSVYSTADSRNRPRNVYMPMLIPESPF